MEKEEEESRLHSQNPFFFFKFIFFGFFAESQDCTRLRDLADMPDKTRISIRKGRKRTDDVLEACLSSSARRKRWRTRSFLPLFRVILRRKRSQRLSFLGRIPPILLFIFGRQNIHNMKNLLNDDVTAISSTNAMNAFLSNPFL